MQKLKNMMQKTSNRVIAVALAAALVFGAAAAGITATLAADGDILMEFPQPNSAVPLAISAAGTEVMASEGGTFSAEVSNPFSASYRIDGDGAVYIKALPTAAPGVVSLGMSTRNSMLSSVPFQLYDPNGLKSVTLANGAKLPVPSKTDTDYNANSIVSTDPAGFDKSKITWSLPYASDVLSRVDADGTIIPKDNGTAMIIGTVTDRWGVKRSIPVMVLVGPQVKIVDGADGKHYAETDATDNGDPVYVEVTPGGKVKAPVKYWKHIDQTPPTQVWPDPENPGEWVDTEPDCLCGDGCACDNGSDCGCGCDEDCTCGDPTPPSIGDGGAGSTEILIELVEGYDIAHRPVIVNGNPLPEVDQISGHPSISWDKDSSSVVVATGLTAAMGPYYASFKAVNSEGSITFNVTVRVTTGSVGPSIDGEGVSGNNVAIVLYENYSSHTHAITIGGNPAPTVTPVSGGDSHISLSGGNVVVSPGLAVRAAPYTAQFVLSNSVSDLTITVSVTVLAAPFEPPAVESINILNDSEVTMYVGDTHQIDWSLEPAGAEGTPTFTPGSSIVSVTNGGLVTAIDTGTTTVTLSLEGITAVINIIVVDLSDFYGKGNVTRIGNGLNFALIDSETNAWVWGRSNTSYALGIGPTAVVPDYAGRMLLNASTAMTGVKKISGSGRSTVILKTDGTVYVCGQYSSGILYEYPTKLSVTNVVDVFAIELDTIVMIRSDNTVYGFGQNVCGQLCIGTSTDTSGTPLGPVRMKMDASTYIDGSAIKDIQGLNGVGFILMKDGTLYGVGVAQRMGLGGSGTPCYPVKVMTGVKQISSSGGGNRIAILKNDGTVWNWGLSIIAGNGSALGTHTTPVQVLTDAGTALADVKAIANCGGTVYALMKNGTVKAWGSNSNYSLGTGDASQPLYAVTVMKDASTPLSGVKQLLDGYSSAGVAVMQDDLIWAWGAVAAGSETIGPYTTAQPYPVPMYFSSSAVKLQMAY